MMEPVLYIAVEGKTDTSVAARICLETGWNPAHIYINDGKARLDKRISGYNNAANEFPWLVIRDLDNDADCAPAIKQELIGNPALWMVCVIAVRTIESWLLADIDSFCRFIGRKAVQIADPEAIEFPKAHLLKIVEESGKKRLIKEMVPAKNSGAKTGPLYSARIHEYVMNYWRPDKAAEKSQSLNYCIGKLKQVRHDFINKIPNADDETNSIDY